MLSIACVLKSGGDFHPRHVSWLAHQIREHLSVKHKFFCLTDQPNEVRRPWVEPIELEHRWRGWWSKLELYRPGLFPAGTVLYIDLDTLIVGNIDRLTEGHQLTALRNFWWTDRIGSGLLAWDTRSCDLSPLYDKFRDDPDHWMRQYGDLTKERLGDQSMLFDHTGGEVERWQQKFPGAVIGYKKHVVPAAGKTPEGARIICFGGRPRPWHTAFGKKIYDLIR